MRSAFAFIKIETGFENDILKEVKEIPSIKEAYIINGVYDLIAKVEAESLDELKEIISQNIQLGAHAHVRGIYITRNALPLPRK